MATKSYVTWEQVEELIDNLQRQVRESAFDLDYISGIPRGGLIPATLLSHQLGIPYLPFDKAVEAIAPRRSRILVVDDICDSGKTFEDIDVYDFITASLHLRITSPYKPEFFANLVEDESWIVYPWERKDSKTIQDYLV